jgi:hypothetical protein
VIIWDDYNVNTPNLYNISMTINRNYAPSMNTPPLSSTFPSTTPPWPFNVTFWASNFTDAEGDPILINCTNTTNSSGSSWLYESYNTAIGNMTIYGTPPPSNSYAGTYNFSCVVRDPYDGTPNVYNFTLIVNVNEPITILSSPSN